MVAVRPHSSSHHRVSFKSSIFSYVFYSLICMEIYVAGFHVLALPQDTSGSCLKPIDWWLPILIPAIKDWGPGLAQVPEGLAERGKHWY